MKTTIISFLSFFLILSLKAQCGPDIAPKQQYSKRGNRSEGFISSKYDIPEPIYRNLLFSGGLKPERNKDLDLIESRAKLKIIHFSYGEFKFANDPAEVISVDAFNPKLPIKIFARDIPGNGCYVMTAELKANSSLKWPVSDVLLKKRITADFNNIGVIGIDRNTDGYIYSPVVIKTKKILKPSNQDYFVITIIPLGKLLEFSYKLDDSKTWVKRTNIPDGDSIRIEIHRKDLVGPHKLNILYKAPGEKQPTSESFSLNF